VNDAGSVASLIAASAALVGMLVVMPRYLSRIARMLVVYQELPARVQSNTDAIRQLAMAIGELARNTGSPGVTVNVPGIAEQPHGTVIHQ
jgi:hypothetical protein